MVPVATQEDDRTNPASIYAATKLAQEDLVRIACGALGIGYAILRLQNVYGEGQSLNNPYTGILSIFSTKVRRGADLPLFEDGEETRDFVHVDDVAEALSRALTQPDPANAVINVGSGIATSVAEVARLLNEALGGNSALRVTGEYRLGDIRHNFADISRLERVLGFRPRVTLDQGLARFADWVLSQELPDDQLDRANAELRARKLMA
jgi:dTDP-L-rhamnose 4-epimerase